MSRAIVRFVFKHCTNRKWLQGIYEQKWEGVIQQWGLRSTTVLDYTVNKKGEQVPKAPADLRLENELYLLSFVKDMGWWDIEQKIHNPGRPDDVGSGLLYIEMMEKFREQGRGVITNSKLPTKPDLPFTFDTFSSSFYVMHPKKKPPEEGDIGDEDDNRGNR